MSIKAEKFVKDPFLIFILLINLCLIAIFFYSHGNISTDIGREALIPQAILNGEVLYKDILNIYGPASYYINAIMYKICEIRLETLYVAGSICSLIFTVFFYSLCEKFFDKGISALLTLLVSTSCLYNSGLYNFIMPYSFAAIYGLTGYLLSTFFTIKYIEDNDKKHLYLSTIIGGFAFACKIEFLFAIIITLFVAIYLKKENIKTLTKALTAFFAFPTLFYIIPVIQGLNNIEIKEAFEIFIKSSSVESVKDFAKEIGTIFAVKDIQIWLISLVKTAIFTAISLILMHFSKNNALKVIALSALTPFVLIIQAETFFTYSCILIAIYLIINFKTLRSENQKLLILLLFSLGGALKTFFNVDTNGYGAYTFPILSIALTCMFLKYISERKKNIDTQTLMVFLIVPIIFSNVIFNLIKLNIYSNKIETQRGTIATEKSWKIGSEKILQTVANKTKENDKVLFLPEGAMFNFLSNRATNMQIYALNMPYIETYGEKKIIEKISDSDIKYIVIIDGLGLYNFNNPEFYFKDNEISIYIQSNYKVLEFEKSDGYKFVFLEKK